MRRCCLALILLVSCGDDDGGGGFDAPPGTVDAPPGSADAATGPDGAVGEDLDMQAADFECILRWDMVGGYRVTNRLGHDPLAVANSPTGGDFPVGTIIQIVPQEAMVKRRAGFSAATQDWEFFALAVSASGTTISARGTTDVVNQFGGNCLDCHDKALPEWDLVCATTHGCDPLPLTTAQLINIQNNDPRCP